MSIQLKAIRKTAGQLALIFIASTLVVYFSNHLEPETLLNIFFIGLLSLGSWMMYKANLVDAKQEEIEAKYREDNK